MPVLILSRCRPGKRAFAGLLFVLSFLTSYAARIDTIGLRSDERYQEIRTEWFLRKGEITKRRDSLAAVVEKHQPQKPSGASRKIREWTARISSLNVTLKNLDNLETSRQIYTLKDTIFKSKGGETLTYAVPRGKDTLIEFLIVNTSTFVHETTHGGQFELGKMAFFRTETGGGMANDLYDERDAYKAQYAFDPDFASKLVDPAPNGPNEITIDWVRDLTHPNSCRIYDTCTTCIDDSSKLCPPANVAWIEVTITSPKKVLDLAYPRFFGDWDKRDANYVLKTDPLFYIAPALRGDVKTFIPQTAYAPPTRPSSPPRSQWLIHRY